MASPLLTRWLPRCLLGLALIFSASLIVLVLVAPVLDTGVVQEGWGHRVLALFAEDAAVRRTAIASALGLAVTACIFFRPSNQPPPRPPRGRRRGTSGRTVAGA